MKRGSVVRLSGPGHPAQEGAELVYLDVTAIHPYEHNPRRGANPEYERIKASIRIDGLGQPLVVTRRPGADSYVVHAGGNTRLQILGELFAETGDPRFGRVACLVRPWTREADVLLAHLKENDLRGELNFLDKALAVVDARRLLEEEGGEALTQLELADTLARSGYGLSQGLISQMLYTVERLWPVLPRALEGGAGRPQIMKLRALDKAARSTWLERTGEPGGEYDEAFATLCRRYDTPDWDSAPLRRALEVEISERADVSLHAVSLEIEARLAGRSPNVMPPDEDPASGVSDTTDVEADGTMPGKAAASSEPVRQPRPATTHPKNAPAACPAPAVTTLGASPEEGHDDDAGEAGEAHPSRPISDGPPLGDIKSLRSRLWTLAARLAQRNGFGDLVQPLSNQGLGFVLQDVPDPALVDRLDEETLAQVSMVWWHLAACAELTVAPLDVLVPALPESSVLRRALLEQDAGLLFASVWTLDPGHAGYRLWRRLDERDWQDLLDLMQAYRALHHAAAERDESLWSAP